MKRFFWLLIFAAALTAAVLAAGRWQIEGQNRTVELVYDLESVQHLAQALDKPIEALLADLKGAGVETIGVQPETLGERLLSGKPLPPGVRDSLPKDQSELGKWLVLPVAFRADDFALLAASGLKPAPKLAVVSWDVEPIWLASQVDLVIISGSGEFAREDLHHFPGRLALVEFHTPDMEQFSAEVGRMVRLHGISQKEIDKLPAERIISRYLRAVRERNLRVLYLRPFLEGPDPWQRSLALLTDLKASLEREGYILGAAEPFSEWAPSGLWKAVVSAGIWAGAVLYGLSLFPKYHGLMSVAGALGWLVNILLAWREPILAAQISALVAAVVFPCLSVRFVGDGNPRLRYAQAAAVSLLGALLIVGTLTGVEFMLKLQEFRGVKVMHVLPILLVVFSLIRPLREWLNSAIPVKYLVLMGIAGLFGVIYILRTGNFGLPVPDWEIRMREGLEQILRTRPRTKELMLGHPALYLALRSEKPERSWLLPVAVVGQLSMVNTFTHIHSPLSISLLRTLYGVVFGYVIGWLVQQVLRLGKRWLGRDRSIGLLRVR